MQVTITTFADHGDDYLPRTVTGTLHAAGILWQWQADTSGSTTSIDYIEPVAPWTQDDDTWTIRLEDGTEFDRDGYGPLFDAVTAHIETVLRRVAEALEDAAQTLLSEAVAA